MNTFQLSCFLATANCLNFARAAEQMNVSQPAITHQIKTLESELNVKLFRRSTRLVELTPEGQAFLTDAQNMVTIAEQAKLRFSSPADRPVEVLSIGCGGYTQLALFSECLHELAMQYKNLHPRLHVVPHNQLFHQLESEAFDVVFDIQEGGAASDKLTFKELCRSPIVCICREDAPLAGQPAVTVEELAAQRLIFCDPINLAPNIAKLQWRLAEEHSPADVHFCSSVESALVLAEAGLGTAILPELLVLQKERLAKIPLAESPELTFGLFYKAYPGDTVRKRFVQLAQRYFAGPQCLPAAAGEGPAALE